MQLCDILTYTAIVRITQHVDRLPFAEGDFNRRAALIGAFIQKISVEAVQDEAIASTVAPLLQEAALSQRLLALDVICALSETAPKLVFRNCMRLAGLIGPSLADAATPAEQRARAAAATGRLVSSIPKSAIPQRRAFRQVMPLLLRLAQAPELSGELTSIWEGISTVRQASIHPRFIDMMYATQAVFG